MGPGEGEEALGFDGFDACFPRDVLVAGVGDVAPGNLAGKEGAVELDLEPLAELAVVRDGAPDAGDGAWSSMRFSIRFESISNLKVA